MVKGGGTPLVLPLTICDLTAIIRPAALVVKKQLHFRKTRYRGLEKQQAKFNIMFALANLILADRPCLAA